MTFKIPNAAEEVEELGYPYCAVTERHVSYMPSSDGCRFNRHYILELPIAAAIKKTQGYGLYAFWPPTKPEYIVFEKEQAAVIFRLFYNP
jgi:hypothetical protein